MKQLTTKKMKQLTTKKMKDILKKIMLKNNIDVFPLPSKNNFDLFLDDETEIETIQKLKEFNLYSKELTNQIQNIYFQNFIFKYKKFLNIKRAIKRFEMFSIDDDSIIIFNDEGYHLGYLYYKDDDFYDKFKDLSEDDKYKFFDLNKNDAKKYMYLLLKDNFSKDLANTKKMLNKRQIIYQTYWGNR